MLNEQEIGYIENIINGSSIVRARTIRQVRSWEFPRSLEALDTLNNEFGKLDFPGLYILIDTKVNKVYIGEAKSVIKRLTTHTNTPEEKIKNWDKAIIVNDGRPAALSDFNDNVVRLAFEIYLIQLFKLNKYQVVAQGETQIFNAQQKDIFNSIVVELDFFLKRKGLIYKFVAKSNEQEILSDELKKLLVKNGYTIQTWHAYEPLINNVKCFIRAGSKKNKGWQVTFRDVFKNALKEGNGYLIMPRGNLPIVPFVKILELFHDKENVFANNTIDIFIAFTEEGKVVLNYKKTSLDISDCAILNR